MIVKFLIFLGIGFYTAHATDLLIKLDSRSNPLSFAAARDLTLIRTLKSDNSMHVFRMNSPLFVNNQFKTLSQNSEVVRCYYNRPSTHKLMAFVPNDPFISNNNALSSWGQWFLVDENNPSFDIRVRGVWERDITGAGVVIGILDQGVQSNHPDLMANVATDLSFDFFDQDANSNPVFSDESHGVSVAGLAAGRGGNGIGICGVAPLAKLASFRLGFTGQGSTEADFVDATKFHSFGNDTSIKVKNHSYGQPVPFIDYLAEAEALRDSANAGTLHCLAAGNERAFQGEDCNKSDLANGPEVITVSAMGISGTVAAYSCYGANVFVTAPSNNGSDNFFGLVTTDLIGADGYVSGDYLDSFGGTSGATPIVAGVMALGVQINSNLNVRWAKHLLARTSRLIDSSDATLESDGGWKINKAGFAFNQNYGFGLVDADRFTSMLTTTYGVTSLETETNQLTLNNLTIPDNDINGVSIEFENLSTNALEEVEVSLNILHDRRGDLEAVLTSPQGTASRLFRATLPEFIFGPEDEEANINWSFTCNAFWGEIPTGKWKLIIADLRNGMGGTLQFGQLVTRSGSLLGNFLTKVLGDWDGDGQAELLLKEKGKSLSKGLFLAKTNTGEVFSFDLSTENNNFFKKAGRIVGTHFLNEDSMSDLLVQHGRHLEAILFSKTIPFEKISILKLKTIRWKARATGDIDRDGQGDIILAEGNKVWVWFSQTKTLKFLFTRHRKAKVVGVITLPDSESAILLQTKNQITIKTLNQIGDLSQPDEQFLLSSKNKVVANFETQLITQSKKGQIFIGSLSEPENPLLLQSESRYLVLGPK